MADVPARDLARSPDPAWLPAVEVAEEIVQLGPGTTGLAEELRAILTETTDDL